MFQLSERSRKNLEGVHPDLVRLVERALQLSEVDFAITEGRRDAKRQLEMLAKGASQTKNSRHITGHAVDVMACGVPGDPWAWKHYEKIAAAFKKAASELCVLMVWGGDWQTLKDGCHFELSRKMYP